MKIDFNVLDPAEKMIYALRSLYINSGYTRYRMSKFEEYDLYSRNKSFLVSDEIITFTDIDGRLMALKPDVTLSIIKNTKDGNATRKLCYNENVYRASGGVKTFKEIMQTGIECIGDIDTKEIIEVLVLAAESLALIDENYILEISDLDLLFSFVNALELEQTDIETVINLIRAKNRHEISSFFERLNIDGKEAKALFDLMNISSCPSAALDSLKRICTEKATVDKMAALEKVLTELILRGYDERIRVDFSLAGSMHYYNGLIFKGYLSGIPESVLSGGQYDRLMRRLGRSSNAIGFAVYLDRLNGLETVKEGGAQI